jgi:predicted ATPase
MTKATKVPGNHATRAPNRASATSITEISVAGFKSVIDEQTIEIRPLTILAGSNSSGKSSMLQPLLLLKQTLEVSYDPGALLLNGPNVKFTSAEQLLSRIGKQRSSDIFEVGIRLNTWQLLQTTFRKEHKLGFRIDQMEISAEDGTLILWPKMTKSDLQKTDVAERLGDVADLKPPPGYGKAALEIMQERCFLEPAWVARGPDASSIFKSLPVGHQWQKIVQEAIHLPGLRGNPERAYPVTAGGPAFPGTFEKYTATLILNWMFAEDQTIEALSNDLKLLKLAGKVAAKSINDVQIEVQVARLPDISPAGPQEMVNIADVGVGVSQTLPILVALRAAKPGRLVFIEQPETHLHPNAQFALAQVLVAAANRGVRVVVETHSSMLLLGVETLVAEGALAPEKVKLHWFQREKDGRTVVQSGDLDEAGRSGDWPEDFDDVTLKAQKRYLDAAEKRLFAR